MKRYAEFAAIAQEQIEEAVAAVRADATRMDAEAMYNRDNARRS